MANHKRVYNLLGLAGIPFLFSLFVYIITLCPTVYFGDSGEFITAAYVLGIPHNPGYPLYCLLGHLFIKLFPWKGVAFSVNLMSAFWAGITVAIISMIIYNLTTSRCISISFSLLLAFSELFWSQAVVAEVYTLNTLNFSILLFTLFRWSKNRNDKLLYLFSFLLGISLSGHLSILCYIPAFLLFLIMTDKNSILKKKRIPVFFLLCLLGLSLYLYLPIRSLANPPLDWGNPETMTNFIRHVTGAEHRQRYIGQHSLTSTIRRSKEILSIYRAQFSITGLAAGIAGWTLFLRKKRVYFIIAGLIIVGDFTYTLFLNTAPISTTAFGLPTYILLSIGMAVLFSWITGRLPNYIHKAEYICFMFPLILLLNNFHYCNMNNFYLAYQYGMDILGNLPKNSIIFSEGDAHLFPILYLKVVEGKRHDVEVIDKGGTLFKDIYGLDNLHKSEVAKRKREVEKEIILKSNRPIYFTSKPNIADIPGKIVIPEGISFHIKKIEDIGREIYMPLIGFMDVREIWLERDFWVRDVVADYLYFFGERARFFKKGNERSFYDMASSIGYDSKWNHIRLARAYLESGDEVRAERECKMALEVDPRFTPANFILGEIYFERKRFDDARIEFEKVLEVDPYQAGVYHNMGLIFLETGDIEKAKREALKSIELDPGLWYPYVLMAEIYKRKGETRKAEYYKKKLQKLNPNLYTK